jgi:sigma-B regulation protein RsbU (phosphoserine phosphatase)
MTMNQSNHVLLIEDNPGDADLVRLRLVESKSSIDISCVDRLADGLQAASAAKPSVILLDLNLPDSRGAETFRKILNKVPDIPIVVLTGQDDEELAVKAVHQGVQDYLVKGAFDSKQLSRALRYAIERQGLLTSLDISRKQQLQFKDQFLSHVSHELRTPLTCIHQFVTILLDGLAGPVLPEQKEHLDTVLRSVNQLRSMIGDLLDASRTESGKTTLNRRCLAIEDVIRQAVAMLRPAAAEKKIGLEIGLDIRAPLVHADSERVMQVLTNLIHNAIKFTPSEGSVIVKTCVVETDPDFVYVSVTDTGIGISADARPLIFERMYQAPDAVDDSRKGLGLGLYIAREIIRQHGGRIWLESESGGGSTFTFTLPLFSLVKQISPVITHQSRLRDFFSLIRVELRPAPAAKGSNWDLLRQRCQELLQRCILPDKDVLLPPIGSTAPDETFLILASANQHGTGVITRRIIEQFAQNTELSAEVVVRVSANSLQHPLEADKKSLIKQIEEIADSITEQAMASLRQNRAKPTMAVANQRGNEELQWKNQKS